MPELTPKNLVGDEDARHDSKIQTVQSGRRETLIGKLNALFEQQLVAIEMQGEGPQRLETLERDCRALDLLARAFDRLVQTEMRTKVSSISTKTQRGATIGDEPVNANATLSVRSEKPADELRDELARRLYGLQQREANTPSVEQTKQG